MNVSKSVGSAFGQMARLALVAAFTLAAGAVSAIAQQDVPKSSAIPAKPSAGESTWVKICTKDQSTQGNQACLVRHEGLEPKSGQILIAAAVRTVEGKDIPYLLINVPTSYTLVVPPGVQIKIDENEPVQLQYSVCLPTSCQVQMPLSKDMIDKMRKGTRMLVAAMNIQGKTMAFPIPLTGFARTSDGPPVDNLAYMAARDKMIQAARQHQKELATQTGQAQPQLPQPPPPLQVQPTPQPQ